MNKLPLHKRVEILNLLTEGNSVRGTARLSRTSKNTVLKLLIDVGRAALKFHNETVVNVKAERINCDEIWSFVFCKERRKPEGTKDVGDAWTFTAIETHTKLMITWYVGERNNISAQAFMADLSSRLSQRIQLTTDGFGPYADAVDMAFGPNVDFAQLVKKYGIKKRLDGTVDKRSQYIGADKTIMMGNPKKKFITTSYIESHNRNMRKDMRRFTRESSGHSKKIENHCHMLALHFFAYNFIKIHSTISVTPAMQANLRKKPMTFEELIGMIEE